MTTDFRSLSPLTLPRRARTGEGNRPKIDSAPFRGGAKRGDFSNDCVVTKDQPNPENELKTKLIGSWIELSPCDSCHIFTFTENDSIIWERIFGSERLSMYFRVVAVVSIRVERNWEIEEEKKVTTSKIIFHTNDILELKPFTPVDY